MIAVTIMLYRTVESRFINQDIIIRGYASEAFVKGLLISCSNIITRAVTCPASVEIKLGNNV